MTRYQMFDILGECYYKIHFISNKVRKKKLI